MKKILKILGVLLLVFSSINTNIYKEVHGLSQEVIDNLNDPNEQIVATNDGTDDGNVISSRNTANITFVQDNNYKLAHANGSNWSYLFYATDDRGEPAFCIQPGVYMYGGNYTAFNPGYLNSEQFKRITLILYYGYPNAGNDLTYRLATQILISETVSGQDYAVFSNGNLVDTSIAETQINNSIARHHILPSFLNSSITVEQNESISITDTNNVLSDYSLVTNSIPGATIDVVGNQINMKFSVPGNYTVELERNALYGKESSLYYWFSNNSQNVVSGRTYEPKTISFDVEVKEILGTANLVKVNDLGQRLPGVTFSLTHPDGTVTTHVTNDIGEISISNLTFGNYVIREIQSLVGYSNPTFEESFSITINGEVVNLNSGQPLVNQRIIGSLELTKYGIEYDDSIESLKDVEFSLTRPDGTVTKHFTDSKGYLIIENLVFGDYEIKETKVGDNYHADFEESFSITEAGQVVKINNGEIIYNKKITGEIVINKEGELEGGTFAPVDNVEFTLYSDLNGNGILEVYESMFFPSTSATTINGKVIFDNIDLTKQYILKETSTLQNLAIDKNEYVVNFDDVETNSEQKKVIKFDFRNLIITSTLEISKVDSKTKNLIPGAELVIEKLNENGDWIEYGTYESKTEVLVIDDVEYGKYRIREVKAPEGYVLANINIEFEVTEDGAKIELVLENSIVTSTLEISKVDSKTKNLIPGAELVIDKLNDNGDWIEYGTYESKTEVLVIDDVEYGKYRIREVKAPEGYVLANINIEFEVTEDGAKIELVLENSIVTSTLEISKVDSKTKNLIAGAELVIEKLNENGDWIEYGTYESKTEVLVIEDVEYGKYRIREVKAPEGYVLANINIEFEVDEDDSKIELVLENSKELVATGNSYIMMYIMPLIVILFVSIRFTYKYKLNRTK